MKKIVTILIGLCTLTVYAQNVNIPDANFKTALVNNSSINTNSDGEIQVSEAQAFTGVIDVQSLSISNYTGLEAFTGITGFNGKFNDVSSIDVSNASNLVSLDLGANTTLSSLNVSSNLQLETLFLAECFALTSLTFGSNSALKTLSLRETGLTTVDLSNLTALEDADLNSIGASTTPPSFLDFSNNVNLKNITVRHTNVTSLDFSNNNKLTFIEVDFNNSMTNLNIKNGANTIITTLIANNNTNLTSICVDDVTFATNQAGWNPGGATYTTSCTLSVDTLKLVGVNVFVDQENGILKTTNNSGVSVTGISVYTITGIEVRNTKNNFVDVSNLRRGIYISKISTSLGTFAVKKILKE